MEDQNIQTADNQTQTVIAPTQQVNPVIAPVKKPFNKKALIVILSAAGFLLLISVLLIVLLKPSSNASFFSGNWKQTGAGVTGSDSAGKYPDYLEIKDSSDLYWYSDSSNKENDYMVGKYTIVDDKNADKNKSAKADSNNYQYYILTVNPDYYLDETGKKIDYTGKSLEYNIYKDSKDSTSFIALNLNSFRGYKFSKDK